MFSETLRSIAAARTIAAVNAARADIDKQASAGVIAPDAAQALGLVARLRLDDLVEAGDQGDDQAAEPAPPRPSRTAPAGDRHPAVIQAAEAAEYPDSGPLVRGTVSVFVDGTERLVKFRIPRSWDASIKALFTAAGLPEDADAEQLAGKSVLVTLGDYIGKDGESRPVVKRWHRPAATTRTAMLDQPREVAAMAHPAGKPTGPAWERDEAAAARAPRRTPAQKAAAEFKANNQGDDDDGGIPF
jgi:hypothetical protein